MFQSNADPSISKHMIAIDDYRVVFALIQYYQMETRWSIRQLLLQAFGVMCSLDKTVVNIMLNSVLPMELARYIVLVFVLHQFNIHFLQRYARKSKKHIEIKLLLFIVNYDIFHG